MLHNHESNVVLLSAVVRLRTPKRPDHLAGHLAHTATRTKGDCCFCCCVFVLCLLLPCSGGRWRFVLRLQYQYLQYQYVFQYVSSIISSARAGIWYVLFQYDIDGNILILARSILYVSRDTFD